ncbi:transcriptional regulator [Actinomadura sp. NBRC 104425]|uniref:TetR/AcrR family transcriptional regulator n=1 Tax=Actinomadura sp. NBRC 104425 TaxID=3032204 RepID=UPI0024A345B7|nr:TetR/AcrR family transcriptional regulator [Actinomadura sp. NBRC 104425]GLZ10225.1 transcriptional regulator [Actinomadura sp. NBRC 104425]
MQTRGVETQSKAASTEGGRRTRDRILRAAAELMFKQGVAGTSIPDVQRHAQVSASQIYHYFGDKKGLTAAVIEYQSTVKLEQQRPLLDNLDSIDALREWCERAAVRLDAVRCAGGCEIGSLASELSDSDPSARLGLAKAFAEWQAAIESGLTRMRERGDLPPDEDVAALAVALLAAIQGGMLLSQVNQDATPYRRAVNVVIDHIADRVAAARAVRPTDH